MYVVPLPPYVTCLPVDFGSVRTKTCLIKKSLLEHNLYIDRIKLHVTKPSLKYVYVPVHFFNAQGLLVCDVQE